MSKDNPTDINHILAALEKSEKLKHWHKPPQDYGADNPEYSEYNRNGLTDPGDLSMISFTEEFAFGESSSGETDDNDEDDDDDEEVVPFPDDLGLPSNIVTSTSQDWMDPAEETREEGNIYSLQIAERAHHQNLLLKRIQDMSLENEYKKTSEQKILKHYQNYMSKLRQIKTDGDAQLEKYYRERDEKLALEELRLRQQEEEATRTVKKQENEYIQYVRQRSSELNKLVEDAERREAEQRNIIQGLVNELHTAKASYVEKHEQMNQLLRDLNGEQTLDPSVETTLNEGVKYVDIVLESAMKDAIAKNELAEAKKTLQNNITYVDGIIQALNVRKEEKIQLETERANQQAEQARHEEAAAQQRAQQEQQEAARQNEKFQNESAVTLEAEDQMAILLAKNRMRYDELKKKMEDNLNAQNELDNEKKKDIGRIITIINQLDGTDHNLNTERLQKLLNFLGGRNVHHNNKRYCTNNDPVMTAYAKNRLMSHIVKIGHDTYAKAKASIAAYAWLVVSLVAAYPDIWEVFLYHLYTTCPYLIPLYVFREEGQSDEDYDKAKGMRQKEKFDAYTSRMGNAALLFGLILAKMSKKNGMPEQAPIVGWKLLAGVLTLHPTAGVSAIVLEQFLMGMGADLQQTYGKQFMKLMNYAINVYLPRVEEITVAGSGSQPMLNQLKLLFDDYRRTHKIKPYEHLNKFN